jgi:hypothetical protein
MVLELITVRIVLLIWLLWSTPATPAHLDYHIQLCPMHAVKISIKTIKYKLNNKIVCGTEAACATGETLCINSKYL